MRKWIDDIRALQKAMYKWNMVQGRRKFYSEEYKVKVCVELIDAADKVADWKIDSL